MNALTTLEAARLAELEPIIERGMDTFVEVGNALQEISDRKLYRGTHRTFRDYVVAKWNISVQRAYQLCEAAAVVNELKMSTNGRQIPMPNERQARELAKLPAQDRAAALELAAESGKVTAEAIRKTAKEAAPDPKQAVKPAPDLTPAEQAAMSRQAAIIDKFEKPTKTKPPKKARVIEVESRVEVQQAAEELDVAMEDIKVVLGKLEDGEVFGADPELLNACADELAKVVRMLRKMAKGAK